MFCSSHWMNKILDCHIAYNIWLTVHFKLLFMVYFKLFWGMGSTFPCSAFRQSICLNGGFQVRLTAEKSKAAPICWNCMVLRYYAIRCPHSQWVWGAINSILAWACVLQGQYDHLWCGKLAQNAHFPASRYGVNGPWSCGQRVSRQDFTHICVMHVSFLWLLKSILIVIFNFLQTELHLSFVLHAHLDQTLSLLKKI